MGVYICHVLKVSIGHYVISVIVCCYLQGVKVPDFPLTLLVIVTTVLCYRAACDVTFC